jgi:hypothetical protein
MIALRKTAAAAVALAGIAATTPAMGIAPGVGIDNTSTTIGIVGFVPVICHARVSAESVPAAAGTVSLGQLREFCNSPHGYRVVADYSPSLAHASLLVDGVAVPLQDDGTTVVSQSDKPAIDTRGIALQLPDDTSGGAISFRIEAL